MAFDIYRLLGCSKENAFKILNEKNIKFEEIPFQNDDSLVTTDIGLKFAIIGNVVVKASEGSESKSVDFSS